MHALHIKMHVAQCNMSHLHRVHYVVDLWPLECCSTPLQWLGKVAGFWQEFAHVLVCAYPEHPKHAEGATMSMLVMQELSASRNCVQMLATRGRALTCCNRGLCHAISVYSKCHH